MPKTILIASNSLDTLTYQPVVEHLVKSGYRTIIYQADLVSDGRAECKIVLDTKGALQVIYDHHIISSRTIGAAWYRRPGVYRDETQDIGHQYSMEHERKALQDSIWTVIPKHRWLNDPYQMDIAGNKLEQLSLARKMGFLTPDTIVSNQWPDIQKLPAKKLIFKMSFGQLYTVDGLKAMYSTVLDNSSASLPLHTLPFPGIWQNYIPKKKEWRVTVVGSQVFAAAIYTTTDAEDDWRKLQETDSVTFKAEPFPQELQAKCLQFLRRLKLRFGAFDFIETPDGEMVFLELNSNGQYGWLEDELGLPISRAIADELIAIAEHTR